MRLARYTIAIPSATSAMSNPSMTPPRTTPHVTSDQSTFTPTSMATRGRAAMSVALARSEVVTSANVRTVHVCTQDCGSRRKSRRLEMRRN